VKSATRSPFASRFRAALLGLAVLGCVAAPRADAASAVLAKNGTLYEVFVTTYGQVISGADAADAVTPIVALRRTLPGLAPTVEVVGGSFSPLIKFGEALEFDDSTQTVFVVYTSLQIQGFIADVHVSIWRDGGWANGRFLPNSGMYFSVNPRILVTRQTYNDFDTTGSVVTKTRSILSLVWWEESALSQARYASLFIEDGALNVDTVVAMNLNELAGASGPTNNQGLPTSSYMYPALQRDLTTNGGVIASFADLATQTQKVLHIGFPDDYTTAAWNASGKAANSRTTPIGRSGRDFPLPTRIDLPFMVVVGTIVSPSDVPTYWWSQSGALSYLSGDTASLAQAAQTIPLRPDFQLDSALSAVRSMTDKQ
jgi:hypothetical protein